MHYFFEYVDDYIFHYLQINLEDMKQSFELSAIVLLRIKDLYSMFNRWDDPKVQLNDEILLKCVTVNEYIFQNFRNRRMCSPKY